MRFGIWIAVSVGCGPMYQAPSAPPATSQAPAQHTSERGDDATASPAPYAEPAPSPEAASPAPPRTGRPAAGDADALVAAHNRVRGKHCAGPLAWSSKLAQVAQRWADSLRDKGCMFSHSGGTYGENLAAGTSGMLDPEAVVKMWYDEIADYKFPNGGFSMKTGHFTQVVWRGTTHLGCGRSQCKGMDIWVCEYDPAGNWEGQYRENVLPVGCR